MIRRPLALLLSVLTAACGGDDSGDPPPPDDDVWTLVVLPDTQYYSASYPEIFEAQTTWIATERERRDIRLVAHVGDITDDNGDAQWQAARQAIEGLGSTPYALVPGNHDMGTGGSADTRDSQIDRYFPRSELADRGTLVDSFPPDSIANTLQTFEGSDSGWLVLGLEFGPRAETLAWADRALGERPAQPAILVTHAYLYEDARYDRISRPEEPFNPYSYGVATETGGVSDGEEMWQALVSKHPNIGFVLSGHVLDDGVGRLTSTRGDGSTVHQLLANYQTRDLGGEGYLRLMEFGPDRVRVRTYSPFLDQALTDAQNDFELPLPVMR